ncbi:hypothetical protein LCGC14_0769010 [marine sediment metagenome]|uniref:UDP-N-acetylglucosamine 2-epimerase domain-containing protein n=1 Tax=marine sediment metagenome TaxID=412755 RepID=A0A0F9SIY4_9ZZZZ
MFLHVLGARPNFIKAFPLLARMKEEGIPYQIVHTDQHYQYTMSEIFFNELNMPPPDFHLETGSGSHAFQTSQVMMKCEDLFQKLKPSAIIVYGDVNSTLGAALAAAKMQITIIHIESGSRSFDKTMPEEINRIMVDHISDVLFSIDKHAVDNLRAEGIKNNVYLSGNIMIDTLHYVLSLKPKYTSCAEYILTLHRPTNVDDPKRLDSILKVVNSLNRQVIFVQHPRIKKIGRYSNIKTISPLGYVDFVHLLQQSCGVITDSGGIQCEASVLNKRCITLRNTTEHLSTIELGTNSLCSDLSLLPALINTAKHMKELPMIWDGHASERIVKVIKELHG